MSSLSLFPVVHRERCLLFPVVHRERCLLFPVVHRQKRARGLQGSGKRARGLLDRRKRAHRLQDYREEKVEHTGRPGQRFCIQFPCVRVSPFSATVIRVGPAVCARVTVLCVQLWPALPRPSSTAAIVIRKRGVLIGHSGSGAGC